MKNNILQRHVDLINEAADIAERIKKLKSLPKRVRSWDSIAKLEREYDRLYNQIHEERLNIEKKIISMEPVERMIIRFRYFDRLEWEAIFMRIHYSQRQTFRIHKGILEKLNNLPGRHE